MFKNHKIISSFKLNSCKFQLISFFLLFPLFSLKDDEKKLDNKPYISLIIVGEGSIPTVSSQSSIKPSKIYFTETNVTISSGPQLYRPIEINNGLKENNITLEFEFIKNDVDISKLFKDLNHIKKVDLTHFTNKVTDTSYMFYNCSDLEEVIIGCLKTQSLTNMAGMFQHTKITSLNLSGIKTKDVKNMDSMFESCSNLKYLNLRNCKFSSLESAEKMFSGCQYSLEFIDIFSLKDKDKDYFDTKIFDLIYSLNRKLIFCINKTEAPKLFQSLSSKGFILNCSFLDSGKIYTEEEEELTDMEDYENEITSKIIFQTNEISTFNFSSKDLFDDKSEEINENTNKISTFNCSSKDLFNGKCEEINENKTLSIEDKDNILTNIMNDIIKGDLNTFIDDIVVRKKEDMIINQDDMALQITTTENQINKEYNKNHKLITINIK